MTTDETATSQPVNDDKDKELLLLEILEQAIADEQAAQAKYRRGAELCRDEDGRALFDQLQREEEAHERLLVNRYTAVKKRLGMHAARGTD
jgi:rubrerythrin